MRNLLKISVLVIMVITYSQTQLYHNSTLTTLTQSFAIAKIPAINNISGIDKGGAVIAIGQKGSPVQNLKCSDALGVRVESDGTVFPANREKGLIVYTYSGYRDITHESGNIPDIYELFQNYPSPLPSRSRGFLQTRKMVLLK